MKILYTLLLLIFVISIAGANERDGSLQDHFWCSRLYNPYYPLNPTNATFPLSNVTDYNPTNYPSPLFKVVPTKSLYTQHDSNFVLVMFLNATICNCNSATYKVDAPSAFDITNGTLTAGQQVTANFSVPSMQINSTMSVRVSIYSGSNLLDQKNVTIRYYSYFSEQVYITNQGMGLNVYDAAWFPMGFYFQFDPAYKFIPIAIDEVRNALQSPIPYLPNPPFDADLYDFLTLSGNMRTRLHVDIHSLAQSPNSQAKWQVLGETIDSLRDHTGVLAYYIADEPDGAGFGLDPSLLLEVYEFIKARDPYHPVTLVLNCITSAPRYVDCADIIMIDPYPIGLSQPVGCDSCVGNAYDVAIRVDEVMREINGSKPLWVVIQAFGGPVEHWNRLPSWQEIRIMSYLSVIHGATGIEYFLEGIPFSRAPWAECRKVSLEINALTPSILSTEQKPEVYSNNAQVHVSAYIESEKGIITILVANTLNSPTTVTITVPSLSSNGSLPVQVLFESRDILATKGVINDMLLGYGTHAYRIAFSVNKLAIASVSPSNLIRNPSFENQTDVGMADAMWPTIVYPVNTAIIDPAYFVDGYFSQRLTNADGSSMQLTAYLVAIPANKTFKISFYARSTLANNSLTLSSTKCLRALTFAVTNANQWQLFSTTFSINHAEQCSFVLELSIVSTVWIDLWQIEPAN